MYGLIRDLALAKYHDTKVEHISEIRHEVQNWNIMFAKDILRANGVNPDDLKHNTHSYWSRFLKYVLPVEWEAWRYFARKGKFPASYEEWAKKVEEIYKTTVKGQRMFKEMARVLKELAEVAFKKKITTVTLPEITATA